jgi:hypothetical protein
VTTLGLIAIDTLITLDVFKYPWLLILKVRGYQNGNRLADDLAPLIWFRTFSTNSLSSASSGTASAWRTATRRSGDMRVVALYAPSAMKLRTKVHEQEECRLGQALDQAVDPRAARARHKGRLSKVKRKPKREPGGISIRAGKILHDISISTHFGGHNCGVLVRNFTLRHCTLTAAGGGSGFLGRVRCRLVVKKCCATTHMGY